MGHGLVFEQLVGIDYSTEKEFLFSDDKNSHKDGTYAATIE
ncbi:hypothetical protein [Candidatus Amoebophilus asiaticus]|nr:hypothetical protein [Candidatus Amoebophilus asiaticus]